MENEIVIYTLFGIVLFVFIVTRWFWWILDVAVDDLLNLFYRDEEKWWWEKELPKAIGKSGFLTRAALNLLNEEGRLRKQVLIMYVIDTDSRDGGKCPEMMLLVQLDSNSGPRKRKKKAEVVQTKRLNTPARIPTFT